MKISGSIRTFIILVFLSSCAKESNHEGFLSSKLKFKKLGNDTIKVSQKAIFKLVLNDPNLKVEKAYFDCNTKGDLQVDEVNYVLKNCDKELFIKKDTIIIQLTPATVGKKKFQEITVLAVDKNDSIFIHKGKFEYFVIE